MLCVKPFAVVRVVNLFPFYTCLYLFSIQHNEISKTMSKSKSKIKIGVVNNATTTTVTSTSSSSSSTTFLPLLCYCVLVVLLLLMSAERSEGFTCSVYRSAVELNQLAFPHNPDYSPHRNYFGAPAVCDDLSSNRTFFVPQNGTERRDVEQQAFAAAFGLGVLSEECRIPATKFLCASAFRECEYEIFSASLPNFFGKCPSSSPLPFHSFHFNLSLLLTDDIWCHYIHSISIASFTMSFSL